MPLAFVFFCFLFYKIMSAGMFDRDLSIIGSGLISISVGIIVFFGLPFVLAWSADVDAKASEGEVHFSGTRFFLGMCLAAAAAVFAGYMIALGFSERFYDEVSNWRRYRDFFEQDVVWFIIMIVIPVVAQYSVIWFMNGQNRQDS